MKFILTILISVNYLLNIYFVARTKKKEIKYVKIAVMKNVFIR